MNVAWVRRVLQGKLRMTFTRGPLPTAALPAANIDKVDEIAGEHHAESVRLRHGMREISTSNDPLSELVSRIVGRRTQVSHKRNESGQY